MSEPTPPRAATDARPELHALTALRAVAALWVVIFHLREYFPIVASQAWRYVEPFSRTGWLGVDLFFVLSGFVIAYTHYEVLRTFTWPAYGNFVRKRFARIYPAYLVMVLLTSLQHFRKLIPDPETTPTLLWRDAGYFLEQVLLLQGWRYPILRTWNIVSWSVSTEWLAYVTCPLTVLAVSKLRSARALLVAGAAHAGIGGLLLQHLGEGGNMRLGVLRIAIAFPLGMIAYRLYALRPQPSVAWARLSLVLLAVIAPASWQLRHYVGGLVIAPFVFPIVVYGLARSDFALLRHRTLLWLGHISYCLYLVHIEVLQDTRWLVPLKRVARHGTAVGLLYLAASVAIAIACAHLLHVWVERPWRLRLLGLRTRPAPVPDAAARADI